MHRQSTFLADATTRDTLTAAGKAKRQPVKPQRPMDEGLFGSSMHQTDLVEAAKAPDRKPWKVIDGDTGAVVYAMDSATEAQTWAGVHNDDEFEGSGRRGRYRVEHKARKP